MRWLTFIVLTERTEPHGCSPHSCVLLRRVLRSISFSRPMELELAREVLQDAEIQRSRAGYMIRGRYSFQRE